MQVPAVRTALALALLVLAAAAAPAPAAVNAPRPNHPEAIPEAPGALTQPLARTPSDVVAARAAERAYASYGKPETLRAPEPVRAASGGGMGTASVVAVVAVALAAGLALGSAVPAVRGRRRHRLGIAG